jgi:ubiquinone/menaquinone biosynthesis C-methylase UbiE
MKIDYSKIADRYDRVRQPHADFWALKIIEYGKVRDSSLILDVGCDRKLRDQFYQVYEMPRFFVDNSIKMLRKALAKDKTRRIHWMLSDAHKLPFKDCCFDCVYMTLVVHHIENKELVLKEIYRVLKKGGSCVIMTHSHYRIKRHFP